MAIEGCHCELAVRLGFSSHTETRSWHDKPQRTWRHERHGARGDDDVPCCDLAADVHPARQAVLDAVGARQLAIADQDVLQAMRLYRFSA